MAWEEVKGSRAERGQVPTVPRMLDEQEAPTWPQHPPCLPKEGFLGGGLAQLVGHEDRRHEIGRGGLEWQPAKVCLYWRERRSPLTASPGNRGVRHFRRIVDVEDGH